MTKLYYQGHASLRLTTNDGRVIYVDPYAGDGYDLPADLILVTHDHSDHNQIKLVTQKPGCTVITNKESLAGGTHNSFTVGDLKITSVTAKNLMHSPKKCVGYIIVIDGVKVYAAGDTSKTTQMQTFAAERIDYALFPCDGIFNMSLNEATECATLIGAKHNIPIHMKPGSLFDPDRAAKWMAPNKLIIKPGEEIELTHDPAN